MARFQCALGIALALALAACGERAANYTAAGNDINASSGEGNATANASATFPCVFDADDHEGWAASISALPGPGPVAPLIVTGRARIGEGFKPILDQPEAEQSMLRLRLAAATDAGPPPADGWHDVRFEMPNPPDIQTVVIVCDIETELARVQVERPQ